MMPHQAGEPVGEDVLEKLVYRSELLLISFAEMCERG